MRINNLTAQGKEHRRRSIRLQGYDYGQAGAYFVTISTYNRLFLFGQVMDGEMCLNDVGQIVEKCWSEIPGHFPHVALDAFVVMPNHIHGIIVLNDVGAQHAVGAQHPVGAQHAVPLQRERFGKPVKGSLPTIIRSFKSATTKQINIVRGIPDIKVWQRNYYEHVIRNDEPLNRIREYIMTNPLRWELDPENPLRAQHAVGARHAVPHAVPPTNPWEV